MIEKVAVMQSDDRRARLQREAAISAERHFLSLKTKDQLIDILADEYGAEPPDERLFKRGKYLQGLIDEIIRRKFG